MAGLMASSVEEPFDANVVGLPWSLELVGMHVAPRRVSGRGAGNPRGAPFGRVQKAKTNVFFVMLFVVCVVGSWHVCSDLSFR